jgi:hypothetical protein
MILVIITILLLLDLKVAIIPFLTYAILYITDMNTNYISGGGKKLLRLKKSDIKIKPELIDQNALDIFLGSKVEISHLFPNAELGKFSRLLDDVPRMKYSRRKQEFKRTLHWGQLKLFLTEVEFLTQVLKTYNESKNESENVSKNESKNVSENESDIYMIYAGAAPGHHDLYLQELFPMIHFELYDPNEFAIKSNDKLKTHVQFFTDKEAEYWKQESHSDKFIVFCTDIRTEPATVENIKENMYMQMKWWQIMKPQLAMFKFRLPWEEGTTEYPKGDIYIQPFPGQTSTETRLIVRADAPIIEYDNSKYEEQLFYHNSINRKKKYPCSLGELSLEKDGIDNCYDCVSCVNIMSEYLTVSGNKTSLNNIISELQEKITFGKHDIYSQSVTSIYDNLTMLHTAYKVGYFDMESSMTKGKSKATKENYNKYIKK